MEYRQAIKVIGGLSTPSKMPWFAWSIPASRCNVGGKLRQHKGTVCSKCYAHKGFYNMPRVRDALERRYQSLSNPAFVEAFIVVLNYHYYHKKNAAVKENRFRWHDSGDLQDMDHLKKIVAIAEATPYIKHWLPTKERKLIWNYIYNYGNYPKNLFVKLSMSKINQLPIRDGTKYRYSFTSVSTEVMSNTHNCPAADPANDCGSCTDCKCDTCWSNTNVNYIIH